MHSRSPIAQTKITLWAFALFHLILPFYSIVKSSRKQRDSLKTNRISLEWSIGYELLFIPKLETYSAKLWHTEQASSNFFSRTNEPTECLIDSLVKIGVERRIFCLLFVPPVSSSSSSHCSTQCTHSTLSPSSVSVPVLSKQIFEEKLLKLDRKLKAFSCKINVTTLTIPDVLMADGAVQKMFFAFNLNCAVTIPIVSTTE